MTDRLLTAAELAERWDLSPATILDRWERGDIPCGRRLFPSKDKLGRKRGPVRFPLSGIEALEDKWQRQEATQAETPCGRPEAVA